jgi:hypothetical protein
MPKRKTFRKRHRKMNQKGGAASNHWLKVTRRNQNGNDINVEIIDSSKKDDLCSTTSSSSSSASGGGANNKTFYTSFDDFVKDDAVDENKILLLELAGDNTKKFANPFELSSLTIITADHINWDVPINC